VCAAAAQLKISRHCAAAAAAVAGSVTDMRMFLQQQRWQIRAPTYMMYTTLYHSTVLSCSTSLSTETVAVYK